MPRIESSVPYQHPSRILSVGKLAAVGAALAFCLIVFGAYVRISDAGLGCPDWPGCYGQLTAPATPEALERAAKQFPQSPVETSKAWIEMAHRYLAGMLGLVVLAMAALAWRGQGNRAAATLLLALVVLQALLGMWTVTLALKPAVVTLHLLGGMASLGLLVWLALSRYYRPDLLRIRRRHALAPWATLALVLLFAQIALGGWVSANYAGLACAEFPLCESRMDFARGFQFWRELGLTAEKTPLSNEALAAIHWSHRVGALVLVVYLSALGLACLRSGTLRALGGIIIALAWAQAALGVANVLLRLPVALAVAHNAAAALLLISVVVLNFHAYRRG